MAKEDYSFVEIDKDNLVEEIVNQPKFYFTYARRLAEARKDYDYAKANKEAVYADLDYKIRNSPEDYGLEKVTEGAVKAAIPDEKEYKKAEQKVIDAKHEVGMLEAVVATLEHRKRMLEKLVDLHGQNYFSTPRASTEAGQELTDKAAYRKGIKRRKGKKKDD